MAHEIACRTLTLTLDERGRIVSLVHRESGYELLAAAAHAVGPWQLGLIRPVSWDDPLPDILIPQLDYEGHEWWANRNEYRADLELDSDDAPAPEIAATDGGATLTWGVPIPGGAASVTIKIATGADGEGLEVRASVSLPPDWAVKRVTFPRLRGLGDLDAPDDDALLYPRNWGVLRRNPLDDMTACTGQYPSGAQWCQMAAWLHGDAGLYLGVLDPQTHHTGIDAQYVEGDEPAPWNIERWHVPQQGESTPDTEWRPLSERLAAGRRPAMQLRCNHWPAQASDWASPYPVVLQGFSGSWYGAARIHRDWATRQRWCRRGPVARRSDAPEALADLDLWFTRYTFPAWSTEVAPAWEFQQAMHELHDFFGMPFGVHWYNWHAFSWHRGFPAHAPVVEGFAEVVDELRALGIVIMPYCQGRLLYRDRPAFEQERDHASVEANGQPYLELYTSQDDWPLALCPSDPWTQMQWREAARMLWRHYGTEGVYFDQITAMPPSLCYHAGHGHPLGGGTHYWAGYDRALADMEDIKREDPRRFLSSESMADAFMDRIDLYLSFVPPLEDYVPLFAAIYGDYTTVMGRCSPTAMMEDTQLFAMAQGEQLLFGGQLGWMSEEILAHPESADFLRDAARLRARVRDVLRRARLDAPLECSVEGQRVCVDIPPAICARPRAVHVERDAIVHTVWRTPEGGVLLLLLNETREPATITFSPPPDWPRAGWTTWTQGTESPESLPASDPMEITMPPLTIVALASR